MSTGYTKQSTYANGNVISATLFNNDFGKLEDAFSYSTDPSETGHAHDGSSGQGGAIAKIGDPDFNNKIQIDGTNNLIKFFVEVGGNTSTEILNVSENALIPVASNVDIGTVANPFLAANITTVTSTDVTSTNVTSTTLTVDTDTLYVDSANDRVGIGTTSPAQALDVVGNINIQGTVPTLVFTDTDHNPDFNIIGGGGKLLFRDETNSTTRMLIDSSGDVGIGINPSARLHVSHSISADTGILTNNNVNGALARAYVTARSDNGEITLTATASDYTGVSSWQDSGVLSTDSDLSGGLILHAGTDDIKFQSGATHTELMRITSAGNVGIGTENPGAMLDIENTDLNNPVTLKVKNLAEATGDTTLPSSELKLEADGVTGTITVEGVGSTDSTLGKVSINGTVGKPLTFGAGVNEFARFDGGNFLIGHEAIGTAQSEQGVVLSGIGRGYFTSESTAADAVLQVTRFDVDSANEYISFDYRDTTNNLAGSLGALQVYATNGLGLRVQNQAFLSSATSTLTLGSQNSEITLGDNLLPNPANDGEINLGSGSSRFNRLYLANNLQLSSDSTDADLQYIYFKNEDSRQAYIRADYSAAEAGNGTGITIATNPSQGMSVERLKISEGGDITFFAEDGTTSGIFWDASAKQLGLNTTSLVSSLNVDSADADASLATFGSVTQTDTSRINLNTDTAAASSFIASYGSAHATEAGNMTIQNTETDGDLFLVAGGNEGIRIDTDGNVGIKNNDPSEALDVTGNIAVSGTVDGVDIATLGANAIVDGDFTSDGFMKRDSAGVYSVDSSTVSGKADLAGATFTGLIEADGGLLIPETFRLEIGNNDFGGDNTYLSTNSSGVTDLHSYNNFVISSATNLQLSGSGNIPLVKGIKLTGQGDYEVSLHYGQGQERLITTSDGITVTGDISLSGTVDGVDIAALDTNKADLSGATFTGDVLFNDGVKAKFGTDSDLAIYHNDSGNSIIEDTGEGALVLKTNGSAFAVLSDEDEYMINASKDGGVTLYYNNVSRLNTTATAVQVGNIDFIVDTDTLYVDATNDRVGIGTSTPSEALDVNGNIKASGTVATGGFTLPSTDGTSGQALVTDGSGNVSFADATVDISGKADLSGAAFTGDVTVAGTAAIGGTVDYSNILGRDNNSDSTLIVDAGSAGQAVKIFSSNSLYGPSIVTVRDTNVSDDSKLFTLQIQGNKTNVPTTFSSISSTVTDAGNTQAELKLDSETIKLEASDVTITGNLAIEGGFDLTDLPSEIGEETTENLHSSTAYAVCVYDTAYDTDGGAWRNKTEYHSWYLEDADATYRSSTKKFPKKVAIDIRGTGQIYIYDLTKPGNPMWKVIPPANYHTASNQTYYYSTNNSYGQNFLQAKNGKIFLKSSHSTVDKGLIYDFAEDQIVKYVGSSSGASNTIEICNSGKLGHDDTLHVDRVIDYGISYSERTDASTGYVDFNPSVFTNETGAKCGLPKASVYFGCVGAGSGRHTEVFHNETDEPGLLSVDNTTGLRAKAIRVVDGRVFTMLESNDNNTYLVGYKGYGVAPGDQANNGGIGNVSFYHQSHTATTSQPSNTLVFPPQTKEGYAMDERAKAFISTNSDNSKISLTMLMDHIFKNGIEDKEEDSVYSIIQADKISGWTTDVSGSTIIFNDKKAGSTTETINDSFSYGAWPYTQGNKGSSTNVIVPGDQADTNNVERVNVATGNSLSGYTADTGATNNPVVTWDGYSNNNNIAGVCLSFWIKKTSNDTGFDIITIGDDDGKQTLLNVDSSNGVNLFYKTTGTTYSTAVLSSAANALTNGEWNQVIITGHGPTYTTSTTTNSRYNDRLSLYVNGKLEDTTFSQDIDIVHGTDGTKIYMDSNYTYSLFRFGNSGRLNDEAIVLKIYNEEKQLFDANRDVFLESNDLARLSYNKQTKTLAFSSESEYAEYSGIVKQFKTTTGNLPNSRAIHSFGPDTIGGGE